VNTRRLLVAGLAVFALAGCSTQTNGTPSAAGNTSAAPESSAAGSSGAAPKVPQALAKASSLTDACATLSAAKVSELGFGTGSPRSSAAGPSCTWLAADNALNQVDVTLMTPNKNGLSDVYDQKAADEYFEPTLVAGYPAVYAGVKDLRKSGQCGLFVAVTDQLSVQIFPQYGDGPGATDPCPVAVKVGEAMIQTLKEG
jgi:hypothetical protein